MNFQFCDNFILIINIFIKNINIFTILLWSYLKKKTKD